ncbi:MAG: hypothetical protein H5T69_00555 [Chloroflexi bacterium]|nr:hypothetical protein [Chloroflexota bacterium]
MPPSNALAHALRQAPFALRITRRKGGLAAIVYRRQADAEGRDRLRRVGALSPLALSAARPMLRDAVGVCGAPAPGPYRPLDTTWGARLACFALLSARLTDGERLLRAAEHLRHADPDQAAWWLGLLLQDDNRRALRALRILTEAVR